MNWCNIVFVDFSALNPIKFPSAFHCDRNEKLDFKLSPFLISGLRNRKGKVMKTFNNRDIVTSLISAPILVLHTATSLVKKMSKGNEVSPPSQLNVPLHQAITANPQFVIADRTHCQYFGNLKVCFYQYSRLQKIRIVGLKNGVRKELNFTPDIASKGGVLYSMESAINWVREVGFKSEISSPVKVPTVPAVSPQEAMKAVQKTEVILPKKQVTQYSTIQTKPFTGAIIKMGEIIRPGKDGQPPYQIFALKLRSEYTGVEKEFSGEHLAELAEKLSLKVGMSVKAQLLGRYPFEVINNGVLESRTRNEFAVSVL